MFSLSLCLNEHGGPVSKQRQRVDQNTRCAYVMPSVRTCTFRNQRFPDRLWIFVTAVYVNWKGIITLKKQGGFGSWFSLSVATNYRLHALCRSESE